MHVAYLFGGYKMFTTNMNIFAFFFFFFFFLHLKKKKKFFYSYKKLISTIKSECKKIHAHAQVKLNY